MPKYRSITLSIMSQWEMKQFPEFPHPDSSQCKYRGPMLGVDGSEARRSTSKSTPSGSTSNADTTLGRVPSISCYVPSIPGVRFFLKYTIEPPHPDGQLFYFKLFMNGRHISSWGVNPRTNPGGQVLRALYEADGKWDFMQKGRKLLKHGGIESRPFLFSPDIDGRSAADDGGLIEIRVFRAKSRKRRAPTLELFRPQGKYGINLPSAGLLDKPQDTRFYDWILVDPKDDPYAAFRFHYRSWEHLQSLQLIPHSHPRSLLKPSYSFAFLAGPAKRQEPLQDTEVEDVGSDSEDNSSISLDDSAPCVSAISTLRSSSELDQSGAGPEYRHGPDEVHEFSPSTQEGKESQLRIPISAFSVPQSTLNEWSYERPLPNLPKAKSSFDHSRVSSTSSKAPSITPSLLPWLDRDSENPSPEPVIGVAAAVHVLRSPSLPDYSPSTERPSLIRAAGRNGTSSNTPSLFGPATNRLALLHEAISLSPNVTLRKARRDRSQATFTRDTIEAGNIGDEEGGPGYHYGSASFPPSEAEWINRQRTLSPVKRDPEHIRIAKLWSPKIEKSKTREDVGQHWKNDLVWDQNHAEYYNEVDAKSLEDRRTAGRTITPGFIEEVQSSTRDWI